MTGFRRSAYASMRQARDGDEMVDFERLDLPPPARILAGRRTFLVVPAASLRVLSDTAFTAIQFKARSSLIRDFCRISLDPMGSAGDRLVADALLENTRIASGGIWPLCQDTGTAAVYGWKGDHILVDGDEELALSEGSAEAWRNKRLRNSQIVPDSLYVERNSGDNSPLACELFAETGSEYRFLFVAKGGGSSNKTSLFQETKRVLQPAAFETFIRKVVKDLGVSACPPYRVVLIVGGQSPEEAMLAAKLAGCGALDGLPCFPGLSGDPFRDLDAESMVMRIAAESGWGAQFGGTALARDARVVRLPRHAASLPVVAAVSCAAHRQAYAYIDGDGFFLERLAGLPEIELIADEARRSFAALAASPEYALPIAQFKKAMRIDLGSNMRVPKNLAAGDLVELHGPVVLARDAAHARLAAILARGESAPDWSHYPVFYAGPTETPAGQVSGSIGPTTSKRMDGYLDDFMSRGIFTVMIGKGERSPACAAACAH
ncbi:MAG: fumarate hydratase, partial [Spirochaetales bacterium]